MPEEPKQVCPHCNYPIGAGHAPDCPLVKEGDFDVENFLKANREAVELLNQTYDKEWRLFRGGMADPESSAECQELIDLNEKRLNPFRAKLFAYLSHLPPEQFEDLQNRKNQEIYTVYHRMKRVIAFRRQLEHEGDIAFTTIVINNVREKSEPQSIFTSRITGNNFQSAIEYGRNVPIWREPANSLRLYYRQKLLDTEKELGFRPEEIKYYAPKGEDLEHTKKCEQVYYKMIEKGINVGLIGG